MSVTSLELSPSQRAAHDSLLAVRETGSVFVLEARQGLGRTTVVRSLAARLGAGFVGAGELFESIKEAHPLRLEEEWCAALIERLRQTKAVVIDDFDAAGFMFGNCSMYPRAGYMELGIRMLCDEAERLGGWLLFVGSARSQTLRERALHYGIPRFTRDDQEFLIRATFPEEHCQELDFAKIRRFAPNLNARQIARASRFVPESGWSTEDLIEYLRSQDLVANVDLGQVEDVNLEDLHGIDDVVEKLEANVILPFENDELANRLQLTPRRGILLYGPPGTGKTTVGRALARRLKSKFFLIDGTFISGTSDFYNGVLRVFQRAKQNAPAVVFVDDSDVIFEAGEEMGFYRYLLTILDGIESEEASRLTVILTAMEIAYLPPALIRSGRVELWLEMKQPDAEARRRILEARLARALPEPVEHDLEPIVAATDGLTGADLRRLVEDAKNTWAHAIANDRTDPFQDHLLAAAADVAKNKTMLAEAEAKASAHFGSRRRPRRAFPPMMFGHMPRPMGVAEDDHG
jgi:transitional endoplasmic reticulum ATPase